MSPRSQEARLDMAGLTKLGNCWEAPPQGENHHSTAHTERLRFAEPVLCPPGPAWLGEQIPPSRPCRPRLQSGAVRALQKREVLQWVAGALGQGEWATGNHRQQSHNDPGLCGS